MMSTLVTEARATLQEAERLLASLPPASADHEAVATLAADLRETCLTLSDPATPSTMSMAAAREAVYRAQAHLRILRSRRERIASA